MAACLALLKSFDRDNAAPQQTIANAAGVVDPLFPEDIELTTGQFAALIDHWLYQGDIPFCQGPLIDWIKDGNFAKPPRYLATMGVRGRAERDVWNAGVG